MSWSSSLSVVEQWGLAQKRNSAYSSLSGGQRQRLLVALALVNSPEVVFLDEMTTGLDPAARRVAWDLIEQIRDRGTTVVLVTHFMDEAEQLCDRVAIVSGGRVVAIDSPQGLINAYASEIKVIFTHAGSDDSFLDEVPGVSGVARNGPRVEVTGAGPLLVRVAAALASHGMEPDDLRVHQPTLEDVFLSVAGRGGLE